MVCVCLANFVQHGRFLFSPFLPKIKLHSKLLGSKHSHYFFSKIWMWSSLVYKSVFCLGKTYVRKTLITLIFSGSIRFLLLC